MPGIPRATFTVSKVVSLSRLAFYEWIPAQETWSQECRHCSWKVRCVEAGSIRWKYFEIFGQNPQTHHTTATWLRGRTGSPKLSSIIPEFRVELECGAPLKVQQANWSSSEKKRLFSIQCKLTSDVNRENSYLNNLRGTLVTVWSSCLAYKSYSKSCPTTTTLDY